MKLISISHSIRLSWVMCFGGIIEGGEHRILWSPWVNPLASITIRRAKFIHVNRKRIFDMPRLAAMKNVDMSCVDVVA